MRVLLAALIVLVAFGIVGVALGVGVSSGWAIAAVWIVVVLTLVGAGYGVKNLLRH